MTIRYKVVNKHTRCSAIVGFNSPYVLRYLKGKTIKALSKTLGIMVFKRRYQAEAFIKVIDSALIRPSIILRVEVFSKGKYPKFVSRWTSHQTNLTWFYQKRYINKKYIKSDSGFDLRIPPKGTLCYDTVKVID